MAIRLIVTGGADRGASSAGAIAAVWNEKIPIDYIFATSVGELNSVAYILNIIGELERVWKTEVDVKRKLQSPAIKKLALGFVKNSPSLFRDDYIKELVDRYITLHNYEEIKKSKTTFEFPALNLNSGKTEIISNRDEIEYEKYKLLMLASISIPGFSSAVKIGKEWYADAGFIDNTGLLYSLRKSRPEDIVIVLHNFPETHTPLDWDFKSWRKALWRATEIKQVTKSGELANLCSAMHQTQENLIKAIETAIPRKFLRGNTKLKQRLINAIKTQFSPDSIPAGGCPIVKKIIHIYPPADLSIFKTATPVFKDLKKAFNHMFWLATGKLREELAKI